MRLFVELVHTLDPAEWQRRHAAGEVPNSLPYGLDRLQRHGHELVVRTAPGKTRDRWLGGVGRRLSGGFDMADMLRDRRRRDCDLSVCWDERT